MIYFPATCNILTPGHIQCLDILSKQDKIVVGLITKKGLKGYKKEIIPWKDRKFILENLKVKVKVVPQNSLNPEFNIRKYKCDKIASGDGWEPKELDCIKKLHLKIINIKLKGEENKRYSSSRIKTCECNKS